MKKRMKPHFAIPKQYHPGVVKCNICGNKVKNYPEVSHVNNGWMHG